VWFGSKNEPQNGSSTISSEHKAFYDAVRSTGNLSMISFDLVSAEVGSNGLDGSVYAEMRNVSIDAHFYNGIAQLQHGPLVRTRMPWHQKYLMHRTLVIVRTGLCLCFIGEWGDSTDGCEH
jgi:hypothetical protein